MENGWKFTSDCQLIVDNQWGGIMQYNGFEFKMIEQNNKEIEFLKNVAKNLRELNKELEEENDRYSEEQMNEMYNYYKGKGY